MEPTTQDLKNDKLLLHVTEQAGCRIQFEITLAPEECQTAHSAALKAVQKRVDLPGFRKGRVPAAMVRKHFHDLIEGEWRDRVAQAAFRSAAELSGIYPWSLEQVQSAEITSLSDETGAILSFQFEREPQVPTIDASSLDFPESVVTSPTEDAIQQRVQNFIESHGKYENVEDRTIIAGDYVRVDAFSLEKDPPELLVENARLNVQTGKNPQWMIDLLIGMKSGETKEGFTAPDPDISEDEKEQFKPTKVQVSVQSIEKLIPPTDEELCKAMGVDSIDALKERIQKQLVKEAEGELANKRRNSLWEQLMKTYPFELPASMLEGEKRRMVRMMVGQMRSKMGDEAVLKQEQEIEALAAREATSNLLRFFLARKLVADAGNEASEHEIITRAVQLMVQDQAGEPSNEAERKRLWDIYRNEAFYQLLIQKAEESLLKVDKTDE